MLRRLWQVNSELAGVARRPGGVKALKILDRDIHLAQWGAVLVWGNEIALTFVEQVKPGADPMQALPHVGIILLAMGVAGYGDYVRGAGKRALKSVNPD